MNACRPGICARWYTLRVQGDQFGSIQELVEVGLYILLRDNFFEVLLALCDSKWKDDSLFLRL